MVVRLRILNAATAPDGVALAASLEDGAVIGRGAASDWVLIDPERHVSSMHARIVRDAAGYRVEDRSTNGTFHNDDGAPIGEGGSRPLAVGDQLRMGRYLVAVEAVELPREAGGAPYADPFAAPRGGAPGAGGLRDAAPPDPDDPFGLASPSSANDPFAPPASSERRPALGDVFEPPRPAARTAFPESAGERWWEDDASSPVEPPRPDQASPEPRPSLPEDPFASPPPQPAPRPAPEPASPGPAPSIGAEPPTGAGEPDRAFDVFLHALGATPPEDRERAAEILGAALREILSGALDLLNARASLRNELRLATTMVRAQENNPLKFSVHVDDALQKLLAAGGPGFMSPVEAAREMMADLRAHELSMMAGVEAGVARMLERLDPEKLDSGPGPKIPGLGGKALKERYKEVHERLKTDLHERSSGSFWRAFSEAYERQAAEIAQRSAGGRR